MGVLGRVGVLDTGRIRQVYRVVRVLVRSWLLLMLGLVEGVVMILDFLDIVLVDWTLILLGVHIDCLLRILKRVFRRDLLFLTRPLLLRRLFEISRERRRPRSYNALSLLIKMNIGRGSHLFDLVLLTHSVLRDLDLDSAVGFLLGGDDGFL